MPTSHGERRRQPKGKASFPLPQTTTSSSTAHLLMPHFFEDVRNTRLFREASGSLGGPRKISLEEEGKKAIRLRT